MAAADLIDNSVQQLNAAAQQNSDSMEILASAARELSGESDNLHELIAQLNLRGKDSEKASRQRAQSVLTG